MADFKLYAFADEAGKELSAQITAMKRNGLNGLEIRSVDGKNVSNLTAAEAREIRKQMDDAGLSVWSIGSPIGKIDIAEGDFAAHLDLFRNTLDVADILGAGNIRLFSFYIPAGQDPAAYRGKVMDQMHQMVEAAKGSTVQLCHENEKGIYGDNAARCLDVLTNVPGLKGIFDPANFVQVGQETVPAWEMLAPWIKYMHIKDALWNGDVVPAGKGEGHVAEILAKFRAQGGEALTLEPHLFQFSSLKTLERKGEESKVGDGKYATPDEAFDVAVNALKGIIEKL